MKIARLSAVAVGATAAVLLFGTTQATATPDRKDLGIQSFSNGVALSGDWNGDGVDTPGLFDFTSGVWLLRNSNDSGDPQIVFQFGDEGEPGIPVVGDWDGNGTDTIGLVRGGDWFLRNSN